MRELAQNCYRFILFLDCMDLDDTIQLFPWLRIDLIRYFGFRVILSIPYVYKITVISTCINDLFRGMFFYTDREV